MIRALIFDFDGLIIDTETPEYEGWETIFRQHGHSLPISEWVRIVGTGRKEAGFDPVSRLERLTGSNLDRAAMEAAAEQHRLGEIARRPVLPGVVEHIEAARARGLRLAVASSSRRGWVTGHLERFELLHHFEIICGKEDVARIKPAPDLFRAALDGLGLEPHEAIVYEDSEPGIRAAKAVGLFVVVVPNPLTRESDLSGADLQLESLADITLEEVIRIAQNGHKR